MLSYFILIFSSAIINIHSQLINYTLYQTNDTCEHNWKGSICLPISSLNTTNQLLSIQLDLNNKNPCSTQIFVYIRTRQCIYCAENIHDINCHYGHLPHAISQDQERVRKGTQITVVGLSLLGVFIIVTVLTLLFIKRSKAHTNLFELFNQQDNSNANIKSINRIKVSGHIKHLQSIPVKLPTNIKATK